MDIANLNVIEFSPGRWSLTNEGTPLALDGSDVFDDRGDLISRIEKRGLFVLPDNTLSRDRPEAYTPDPAPPTEDPPTDPSSPNNQPKPKAPTEVASAPESLEAAGSGEAESAPPTQTVASVGSSVENALGVKGMALRVEKLNTATKPRAKRVTKTPAKVEGKPRFTDEQKQARAEYAKQYRAKMTDEQRAAAKAKAAERQARWRANNPTKAAEYAKTSSQNRKQRYNEDPEYRADYRRKQRDYADSKATDE